MGQWRLIRKGLLTERDRRSPESAATEALCHGVFIQENLNVGTTGVRQQPTIGFYKHISLANIDLIEH